MSNHPLFVIKNNSKTNLGETELIPEKKGNSNHYCFPFFQSSTDGLSLMLCNDLFCEIQNLCILQTYVATIGTGLNVFSN